MKEDQQRFLTLVSRPPARLTVEQTAWVLNCQVYDIPVLIAARLLKPLGVPPHNGTKFFGTAEILELAQDRAWLARVTNAVYQHWHHKNHGKRNGALRILNDADEEGTGEIVRAKPTRSTSPRRSTANLDS